MAVPPDLSTIDITTNLNAPVNPATFIPGKTDVASGSGIWKITPPADSAIAISDPGTEGQFPNIELAMDMKTLGTSTMSFIGPVAPTPADAIGFTSKFEFMFINDTGSTLQNILLTLANSDPRTPLNLVPGNIAFGHDVQANYAFFTDLVPNAFSPGETVSQFSPDGQPTTSTGAAASSIVLSGPVAPGGIVTGSVAVHNTEQMTGNNDFVMMITPLTA
jgi:hypothetical protein